MTEPAIRAKPPAVPRRSPERSAARSGALLIRGPGSTLLLSLWVPALRSSAKGAAPRPGHEWTVVSPHFLYQTRLTNLRRCPQRSPDAAQRPSRCSAERVPSMIGSLEVKVLYPA
jgi:hypothetical protein